MKRQSVDKNCFPETYRVTLFFPGVCNLHKHSIFFCVSNWTLRSIFSASKRRMSASQDAMTHSGNISAWMHACMHAYIHTCILYLILQVNLQAAKRWCGTAASQHKGPGKQGQIVARARNICCGHKKGFRFCSETFCVRKNCFPICVPRNIMSNNVSAIICPRLPRP